MSNLPTVQYKELAHCDKATPERISRILDSLRAGNTLKTASAVAGIARQTLNEWADLSPDLAEDIATAQAQFTSAMVSHIVTAAPEDWKAASWLLAKNPHSREDYGERNTGSGGINIVLGIARDEPERITIEGTAHTVE